jgi:type IV pilus assembly protein PilA
MKPDVSLKYLAYLRNRRNKGEQGFTLIELLVVVIIIGVLAAVALPNLLGQIGKARETDGKNGAGTINRAQQAFHFEKQRFTTGLDSTTLASNTTSNELGVVVPTSEYFRFFVGNVTGGNSTETNVNNSGTVPDYAFVRADALLGDPGNTQPATDPQHGKDQGVREYSGKIAYDGQGRYSQVICRAEVVGSEQSSINDATDYNLLQDTAICGVDGEVVE